MTRALSRTLLVGIALYAGGAKAAVLDDCRQDRIADIRVQACSIVIDSPDYAVADKVLAYNNRGEARTEAGALTQAIRDFSESIRLQPANGAAYAGRGRARFAANAFQGALADYSEAIRLLPATAELHIERGHVYLAIGNADASIRDLTEALRLDPGNASARNNRGLAYRKKGEARLALEDYNSAIAINPVYALAYANRGYLLESQGKRKDAIADLTTSLRLDPSQVAVRVALQRLGAIDPAERESDLRVRQGRQLADVNCSGCHAIGKDGASPNVNAPAFRDLQRRYRMLSLRKPITRGIAAPHDQMPQFALLDGDVDMIVAYINSLAIRK